MTFQSFLFAIATEVAGFAAIVAVASTLGTVAGHVSGLVAIETAGAEARAAVATVGAFASHVADLAAVIAGRIVGALLALLGDVADTVAAITPILLFLAFPREMALPIALVAFIPAAESSGASVTSAASSIASLGAVTGEMSRAVTSVASTVHSRPCTRLNSPFLLRQPKKTKINYKIDDFLR